MRLPLIVITLSLLSGCAMHNDMYNNNFPAVVAVAPPEKLIGVWTGSIGYYLATVSIKSDGTGIMCASWSGRDSINALKYDGKEVRFSDSSRTTVKKLNAKVLVLRANYYFGADYTFYRDDSLKQAAPYCIEKLK